MQLKKTNEKTLCYIGQISQNDKTVEIEFQPALKKEWIKALKSNRFKRGIDALCQKDPNSNKHLYCPLGVLIEVLIRKDFLIEKSKNTKRTISMSTPINIIIVKVPTFSHVNSLNSLASPSIMNKKLDSLMIMNITSKKSPKL